MIVKLSMVVCSYFLLVSTAHAETWKVMEIKCGTAPLTDAKKCNRDGEAGSELEIIVNPSTQKAQITVTKNSGEYFSNVSIVPDSCSVIDGSNWICKDEIRSSPKASIQIEMIKTYGMRHGHYFYELTGGSPPNYYTSSISGWRYWAYRLGVLGLKSAELYD
jgi:hypothetical protein